MESPSYSEWPASEYSGDREASIIILFFSPQACGRQMLRLIDLLHQANSIHLR